MKRCKISFCKSVPVTCESRGTQTSCFYGLPLKLSRNLSWLFLTFFVFSKGQVCCSIYLLESIYSSAHCCLPSLEHENKDHFSSAHPCSLSALRNVFHLFWAGGTVPDTACSTPRPRSSCSGPQALRVQSTRQSCPQML